MIIGHKKQIEFLKNSILSSRLSHAYLFSGPSKIGKKTIAIEFAKLINCKNPKTEKEICNLCISCKSFLNNTHPDFDIIALNDEKKEIQISQIRDLVQKLSMKSFFGCYKIIIIDQAHLMNTQSQNCLLKTLEEPKGKTVLILITEHSEALLKTIYSRVQEIKFFPFSKKQIKDFLLKQNISEQEIKRIAGLCLGRPGKALELLNTVENKKDNAQEILKVLNADLENRFKYAESWSKIDSVKILNDYLRYLREILLLKAGAQTNINIIPQQFKSISLMEIKKIIQNLQETMFLISTKNINKRLALELLMLNL
ncbi:MAG: DNA polymerase III subunit [Candidatus Pacebacteria bacterium]|nr:DNA polymerase III subunit [Candidatus Paceibacterota bacterium]